MCLKFQRVSRLAFVTAYRRKNQPNFARSLAISLAGTRYIHFWGSCPLTQFCQVHNSLYVHVLRSPILAALLHSTPAAGVSQTLWHGTRNGITELSQRAPPIFGWAAITLGVGPHSGFYFFAFRGLTLLVGHREEHLACKPLSDEVLALLSVWSKVQIANGPADATVVPSCFASLKSRLV